MSDFFIARQPIFNAKLELYAYELLFRNSMRNAAPGDINQDAATAQVLTASADVGLQRLVGRHIAFVNLPDRFLADPALLPLPPDGLVLEVLESVDIDEEILEGMRTLNECGFSLALDDFVYDESYEAAFELVDLVKIDIRITAPEEWAGEIARLKKRGLTVLAEKVETREEYQRLADLGCDLFQGYFFARPRIIPGKRLVTSRASLLNLLSRINDPGTEPETLAELVSRDVTLSVRALNYVNSAANALPRRIDSIRDAVIYLGRKRIRNWVTVYLMFSVDDKPSELVTLGLVRARFCELLAQDINAEDPGAFFTIGLLSVLDSLMDAPMKEILNNMSLTGAMRAALLDHEGDGGLILELAIALERGDGSDLDRLGFQLDPAQIAERHIEAMYWADESMETIQH